MKCESNVQPMCLGPNGKFSLRHYDIRYSALEALRHAEKRGLNYDNFIWTPVNLFIENYLIYIFGSKRNDNNNYKKNSINRYY